MVLVSGTVSKPIITTFKRNPNGDIELEGSSMNIVELEAIDVISEDAIRRQTPSEADAMMKEALAQQLAKRIIDEDLIEIHSEFLPRDYGYRRFHTKLKVVQE